MKQRPGPTWLLAATHMGWLGLFLLTPIAFMAWLSLLTPAGFNSYADHVSLDNYLRLVQPPYPRIIFVSICYAAATTVACLLLAFPLALAISFAPKRWRNPLLLVICLPFWVSTLVRVFALQQILGRQGIVNSSLGWIWEKATILWPTAPEFTPLPLLFSGTGVLLGLIYAFLPFGILPIYAAIARMDKRLLEASHDLGASAWYTTVRVIMPLVRTGITAAAILIFVPALGAFFISELMGSPGDILIGNIIELNFKEGNNWPFGAALSMGMLILAFAIFAIAFWKRDGNARHNG